MNQDIINILTQPLEHEWSVQGLGMMRTYLNDTQRLHLWHNSIAVLGATSLHDHAWNFTSEIMFGCMKQTRSVIQLVDDNSSIRGGAYMKQRVLCGEGGGARGEPEEIRLSAGPIESYYAGDTYRLEAPEIHNPLPMNNTVTIITREFLEDRDYANVFYPKGGEFGSAEPRPASRAEILYITREVLHAYQESSP